MTTPSPARLAKLAPALLSVVQRLPVAPDKELPGLKPEAAALEVAAYAEPRAVRVVIVQDDSPADPREDTNCLGRIIHWHSRYKIGEGAENIPQEEADDYLRDAAVKLPIFMYDHSEVTIATTPFGCRFDSGQVGWIYCNADDLIREKITPEQAEKCLRAEILIQDQWMRGDVYGVQIYDQDGDLMDSCYGFFGDDWKDNGVMEYVPEHLHDTSKWTFKP